MENIKNKLFTLVTTGTLLLSSVPAFAATNIQTRKDINVDSSAIGTMVVQENTQRAINGKDVNLLEINSKGITDSAIGIFVEDITDVTQIVGQDIDVKEIDVSQITNSVANTWIQKKAELLAVQEK